MNAAPEIHESDVELVGDLAKAGDDAGFGHAALRNIQGDSRCDTLAAKSMRLNASLARQNETDPPVKWPRLTGTS
jgi:hypothetical protein